MRLSRIEVAGFRGIRSKLEIEVPPGFLIISGRNGSGKTSICDAIEFALTGTIRWREDETERRERIGDYIWWRGPNSANEHFVQLGLVDGSGNQHHVRRDQDGVEVDGATLEDLLTRESKAPESAIERICETSVIRDEEITGLSIESAERERYRMVKEAVGSPMMPQLRIRSEKLKNQVEVERDKAKDLRDERQEEVNRLLEKRSQLAGRIEEAKEVEDSVSLLKEELGVNNNQETEVSRLAQEGRSRIAALKTKKQTLEATLDDLGEIVDGLEELKAHQSAAKQELVDQKEELALRQEAVQEAKRRLEKVRRQKPNLSLLTDLESAGSEIGLRDGACPLCGSNLTVAEYKSHISKLHEEVADHRDELKVLQEDKTSAKKEYEETVEKLEHLTAHLDDIENSIDDHTRRVERLTIELNELGLEVDEEEDPDVETLHRMAQRELTQTMRQIPTLEAAVESVEASAAITELDEVQQKLTKAQEKVAEAEKRFEKYNQAYDKIDSTGRILSRYEGKIVDERLHSLRPLLQELYLRLRPHIDWREVDYELRGDVKRFLSLSVGEDLNPRFMFSSGQRRASGLAFLLAVYLSTESSWSRFRSLVLDDPIQHIDDYRAIHIVEVLSSIRHRGLQLLITVEDEQLARLLGRRLNLNEQRGRHIQLEYEPGAGCSIDDQRTIMLPSKGIFAAG